MSVTDYFGWRVPDMSEDPDGEEGWRELAEDVEATILNSDWTSYTPVITSQNLSFQPSFPNGTFQGRWRRRKRYVDVAIYIGFGTSVVGGRGALYVSLPVAAVNSTPIDEQWMEGFLVVNAGLNYPVNALVRPGTSKLEMWVPVSQTGTNTWAWQAADSTGANGTGYPAVSGAQSISSAGWLAINGRYRVT